MARRRYDTHSNAFRAEAVRQAGGTDRARLVSRLSPLVRDASAVRAPLAFALLRRAEAAIDEWELGCEGAQQGTMARS